MKGKRDAILYAPISSSPLIQLFHSKPLNGTMGIFGFVQALLVAVPDRSDGDINANPKVKQLVKQHGRDISHYPPDKP